MRTTDLDHTDPTHLAAVRAAAGRKVGQALNAAQAKALILMRQRELRGRGAVPHKGSSSVLEGLGLATCRRAATMRDMYACHYKTTAKGSVVLTTACRALAAA